MAKFRFQDLLIWQRAVIVGNKLIDISEKLEEIKSLDSQSSFEELLLAYPIISQKAQDQIQIQIFVDF